MSDPNGELAAAPTVLLPAATPPPPELPAQSPLSPPTRLRLFANFLLDVLLGVVLVLLVGTLFSTPLIVYDLMVNDGAGLAGTSDFLAESSPAVVVASLFAMLVAALVLWLLRGRGLADAQPPRPALSSYTLAVLAGVGIQAAGLAIALAADLLGVPTDPSNAAPIIALQQQAPALSWLMIVIVAPLGEELMFRHVLLRRFAVAGRGLLGLAVTALLFASIHEVRPWESGWTTWAVTVSVYVVMGLGFGAVYLRTRRLGAAFVAHATCNLLAMLLLAFSPS